MSDTVNLGFTAVPYSGDDDPFENNWSGKRSKALASIQAVLAQDPDSSLLCYTDTTIWHRNEKEYVLCHENLWSTKKARSANHARAFVLSFLRLF